MNARHTARHTDSVRPRLTPASTYARFAPYVRRCLDGFGVREADLPDLCQEVFLVAHGKRRLLPAIDRVDLWLREICRRVAAGYRRRAGHRFEVFGCEVECPDPGAGEVDEPDAGGEHALLRRALNHLDDESRDLLALHDGGDMPLTDLARLVAHDRKTVRSRLARARRRVSRWLRDDMPAADLAPAAPRITPATTPVMRELAARGRAVGCAAQQLEVLRISPEICSGALGNVAIADWRGPRVDAATLEAAIGAAPVAVEKCGGEFIYLALIEATVLPPTLETRQKIVDAFEMVGPYVSGFAVVLLGENGRINRPILEGLLLLARPRFPTGFFSSVGEAAAWVCAMGAHGRDCALAPDALAAAAEQVRRLAAERPDDRRHVRSFPVVRA
jgi:RNA polymerase sigma-70 factor (ECF subfamily)